MEKKIYEFESLDDFGYKAIPKLNGVEFVKCDCSFDGSLKTNQNSVYVNGDLTSGKYFSLDDILSGGTTSIPNEWNEKEQAELALDYTIPSSLAYLGSLYSTVQISINKIIDTYPNGFLIVTAITGTNALMFNASDTYQYGGVPFKSLNYSDFELVQTLNGVYDNTFQIIAEITGITFSLFIELDGQPSVAGGYEHYIQPKQITLDKFYSTLSQYEKDLLVPPFNRENYWPRDLLATNNILLDGDRFDEFVEREFSWASDADDEVCNFMWRKLYPDGQKILDTSDGLMQKLVLCMAMNFDNIKRYQDQLKYQHTIGYENRNHISKNLIDLMASQWNWDVGHKLNQSDYSEYVYSLYENYVTGQSQQKLSSKDVNFEIWRRILANLTTLYKKKGTKEAIKYVANMYGLPEELLWIDELVEISSSGKKSELIESESNIIVPMSGNSYYVDEDGIVKTLSYKVIKNTKYLNINCSPYDAIDFDFYDWASIGHPAITNINNVVTIITSTTQTKREFFNTIYRNTIKSDGSSRYESSYPLLENEGNLYYRISPNKLTINTLDPYINFLDDNWNILMTNLVPASSKLISLGTLYKNPMWRREKHKWNSSELEQKELPFNDSIQFEIMTPVFEYIKQNNGVISIDNISGFKSVNLSSNIESPSIVSTKEINLASSVSIEGFLPTTNNKFSCTIDIEDPHSEYLRSVEDSIQFDYIYSSKTYSVNSPLLEPISGQYGTLDYVNYNSDSLVVTNQNTFDIVFSASNLSDSGYTKFEIDLFKKNYSSTTIDTSREYSILSIDNENDSYGLYRVSNLDNIEDNDYISIETNTTPYIKKVVKITYADRDKSLIRTYPQIGISQSNNVKFNRVINFFNWSSPDQSVVITNYPTGNTGNFLLPEINVNSRIDNTFSTSGTVTVGGLNYLNSELLVDKEEYFLRTRVITHAPISWGDISGLVRFPFSGGSLLDSGYDLNYINEIKYSGRYFMYMKTPKIPVTSVINSQRVVATSDTPEYHQSIDASITIRWNGVSDSNRLEIKYMPVTSVTAYTSYTQIADSYWDQSNIVNINVPARDNVGDDYIYTVQTTLEPDTYYWWKINNYRNKINMFGRNLECYSSTEPKLVHTGGFSGGGRREGEIPVEPELPTISDFTSLNQD